MEQFIESISKFTQPTIGAVSIAVAFSLPDFFSVLRNHVRKIDYFFLNLSFSGLGLVVSYFLSLGYDKNEINTNHLINEVTTPFISLLSAAIALLLKNEKQNVFEYGRHIGAFLLSTAFCYDVFINLARVA